jgi:ectonucleotide pyrophosphatase/phosphodiesterase family member 5
MIKNAIIVLLLSAAALFSEVPKTYTIVVILDGFRYDYINRGLTPNIDSIIADGVSASSLQPVFPTVSFPNIISSLTGLEPATHGIIANRFMNPYTKQVFNPDDSLNNLDDWLTGETLFKTAKKYGIKTASCYLPLIQKEYSDYYYKYNEKTTCNERIDRTLELLKLPYNIRLEIIYLFLEEADIAGHKYGIKSEETDKSIMYCDLLIGNIRDSISKFGIADSANLIIYSTHGMANVDSNNTFQISKALLDNNLNVFNSGSFALIYSKESDKDVIKSFSNPNAIIEKVIPKTVVSPQFIIKANPGFLISFDSTDLELKGAHGYDDYHLDMHGIFCASGVSFQKGIRTGSLNILDIFPLICRIYNFQNFENTDMTYRKSDFLLDRRKKE